MPELPEVQSTVDYLAPKLTGRSISSCTILWSRTLASHTPKKFESKLRDKKITAVSRRGKFIVIWFNQTALLIHLRMSGTIEVISSLIKRDPYDRVIMTLDNNKELRFNDVRKFGKIYLTDDSESILGRLGIEPLSPEFTNNKFKEMLAEKRGSIKPLLLNQSFIAGIGNIYADESLWLSKIHPERVASSLKESEIINLHAAIQAVLTEAISLKGTDNGDDVVSVGMYAPKVYGKGTHPCPRCGKSINRIVVGQRGTHFCRGCQKISQHGR